MFHKILLPLDGSILSERAIPYAVSLAKASAAELILVRAAEAQFVSIDISPAGVQMDALREAETGLSTIVDRLRPEGLTITPCACYGDPDWAICDEADMRGVDLIVMSTHGRSGLGRWIYGSVADRVLRRADSPVLLIPARSSRPWVSSQSRKVIVPLETSELARDALKPAIELARTLEAGLLLLNVIEPPILNYGYGAMYAYLTFNPEEAIAAGQKYLKTVAAGLSATGLTVETSAQVGEVAETITEAAASEGVVAIAMASHGYGGLKRLALGSATTGVIQRSPVPVLVLRPSRSSASPAVSAQGAFSVSGSEADLLRRGLNELLKASPDPKVAGSTRELLKRMEESGPRITESGNPDHD